MAQADHFECDKAVEAFLSRTVNYSLAAPPDLLRQFIITKVSQHSRPERGATPDRDAAPSRKVLRIIAARRPDLIGKQTKTGLQQACATKILRRLREDFSPALPASLGGGHHDDRSAISPSVRYCKKFSGWLRSQNSNQVAQLIFDIARQRDRVSDLFAQPF